MIRNVFATRKNALFMPFLMAGHPSPELSLDAILTLAESGADLIELGVPCSDPVADGPVNQRAAETALSAGMTLRKTLDIIRTVRDKGCQTPIVLMIYLNLILAMGRDEFAKAAVAAGVDGVLIVDLPAEAEVFYQQLKQEGLDIVLLASPTTEPQRLSLIKKLDPAFIYYISRLGVTGMQANVAPTLKKEVGQVREIAQDIPIAVGFGISKPEHVQMIGEFADGVVVGSLIVKTLGEKGIEGMKTVVKALVSL